MCPSRLKSPVATPDGMKSAGIVLRNWNPGSGSGFPASKLGVVSVTDTFGGSKAISARGRLKYCRYSGPKRDARFHPRNRVGLLVGSTRIPGSGGVDGRIIKPAARAG